MNPDVNNSAGTTTKMRTTGETATSTRMAQLRAWTPLGILAAFVICLLVLATRLSPDAALSKPSVPVIAHTEGVVAAQSVERAKNYAWLNRKQREAYEPLESRIAAPKGFTRLPAPSRSFADWLRFLPVMPPDAPVKTGRGAIVAKSDDPRLAAVIALQPHGDAVLTSINMILRVRAEYLWSCREPLEVTFHFTNGDKFDWQGWAGGLRPRVHGRDVEFRQVARKDNSRINYCGYLETLFKYASAHSLLSDTREAKDKAITCGDVFVTKKQRGRALIVLDIATHPDGRLAILLAQGGKPAQTLHVLRGPMENGWFPITANQPLDAGQAGVFQLNQLRHWAN